MAATSVLVLLLLQLTASGRRVAAALTHGAVLLSHVDYNDMSPEERTALAQPLAESVASVVGVSPQHVFDKAQQPGLTSVLPGNSVEDWMPPAWPTHKTSGTVVEFSIELPSETAYLAQDSLESLDFETRVNTVVHKVFGKKSKAVSGQEVKIVTAAMSAIQPTTPSPKEAAQQHAAEEKAEEEAEKDARTHGWELLGFLALAAVLCLIGICRCLCTESSARTQAAGELSLQSLHERLPGQHNLTASHLDKAGVPIYMPMPQNWMAGMNSTPDLTQQASAFQGYAVAPGFSLHPMTQATYQPGSGH
eukprot:TRINITY_DN1031_c1_g2_i1.p1 TRINITY_DN1031_c1_g2~~TRINITY_DN1031_c1_g2_i1.p1  ORF type:complete len:306 (-),score=72.93 TRINITY_DN1031_c1_g2_i1:376-1293(-)